MFQVVQGYKFNIFYPDLIDKLEAPTYSLEKDPGADEHGSTCMLRYAVSALLLEHCKAVNDPESITLWRRLFIFVCLGMLLGLEAPVILPASIPSLVVSLSVSWHTYGVMQAVSGACS